MAVRVARSSSGSSFSSMSGMSLMTSQKRISTRAPSVHGGAGGYGTRVSRALSRSMSTSSAAEWMDAFSGQTSLVGNEKLTMQNLNDRLASYLEKVRSLESANMQLEIKIREFYEKKAPTVSKDYASFFSTISDLRSQILARFTNNQRILLQIDNSQMTADDFKLKYETELNMSNSVMADLVQLRAVRDGMTFSITDLEGQVEGLMEELVYMKRNHQDEMSQLSTQSYAEVDVGIQTAESINLEKVMAEMREQYELIIAKNSREVEQWFQNQVASLQTEITTRTTEVNTFASELSELKRTYQNLEISRQSAYTEVQCVQGSVEEVNSRFSIQLSQLQVTLSRLETELQQVRASMEQQQEAYTILLDIKMRLEMEIAEYRRLLEGEFSERKKVELLIVSKEDKKVVEKSMMEEMVVVEEVEEVVEEYKPHIEKRIRTIVEELVDGQVVAVSTNTKVESIQ